MELNHAAKVRLIRSLEKSYGRMCASFNALMKNIDSSKDGTAPVFKLIDFNAKQ
jgi:hypothetical protein